MKKAFFHLLLSAVLLALPCGAFSADTSVDATTMLRLEQRDVSGSSRQSIMPATQFLGLDAANLADGQLSLHIYGWGRADLGDKSYNSDTVDGSITYGYLHYRFKQANADVRAGRVFVHEGIVNEHLDGVSARSELPLGFGVSAFGGAPVHTRHLTGEKSDGKGSTLFGGRANYRYKGMLEVGVAGVYEGQAPTLTRYTNGNHRLLGGDVWISPHRMVEFLGHTSYNPETKGVAEHDYLLNVKPFQGVVLAGAFHEQRGLNFFNASPLFTSMPTFDPADDSRSVGGSASWEINRSVEVSADYKHYTRDRGNADRYGADAKVSFVNNAVRSGVGYHYLRADQAFAIGTSPSASYHELRGYALHDTPGYFAAVDAIGYFFKEKIHNESSAWEAICSLGYHLTPALALSGDFSYGRNPQFVEEAKGLIRLTYNMTFDGKGAKK